MQVCHGKAARSPARANVRSTAHSPRNALCSADRNIWVHDRRRLFRLSGRRASSF
jgi:hypothetical protein